MDQIEVTVVYDRKAFFLSAETETNRNSHFSFRPKPILKPKRIFCFGRNRYRNRNYDIPKKCNQFSTMGCTKMQKISLFGKKWRRKNKKWILCGFYKFLDILIFNFRCFPCRDYVILLEIWDSVSYRNRISVSANTETEMCFTVSAKPKFG